MAKFIKEADEKIFDHRIRNAKSQAEKITIVDCTTTSIMELDLS